MFRLIQLSSIDSIFEFWTGRLKNQATASQLNQSNHSKHSNAIESIKKAPRCEQQGAIQVEDCFD